MVAAPSGGVTIRGGDPGKAAPHESQNRAPARTSIAHEGHCTGNCAPQPSQNLAASRLSAPHFEQRILPHSGRDSFGPVQLCCLLGRVEALSCIG